MTDSTAAKAEILRSIRQHLAVSRPIDAVYNEHHMPPDHAATARYDQSAADLLLQFKTNLEAVAGKCLIVSSDQEARMAIQEIIAELAQQTVAVSDSSRLNSLLDRISINATILKDAAKKDLFDCEVGMTAAQWAIAETGTLVLESDRERNRLTSLLPPVHICVLDEKNIRMTMGEILDSVQHNLSPTVTFITGPSRTSDIELTLAIGVHGPRELHVIIIASDTNG
jgi:L-lactate dehydrogenase complex protein LldG